jgi:NAD(P)-dependent dehydrogenase (short-subunit alcohol dehydrogenase family)
MTPTPGRFQGKVAVVTGGASGIGAEVCRRLIAEGAQVVAGDLSQEGLVALEQELGPDLVGRRVDVTAEAEVEALVLTALERFGHLDVAFNVAGAARGGPIVDLDMEDLAFSIGVCLTGVVHAMKHEARAMKESGGGAIVNVASLNSEVPMFGGLAYCVAKAGAAMASQVGALELAQHSIRVNAVSPGLVDTPLVAGLMSLPEVVQAYRDRIPMDRAAHPAEVAAACLYLASDDASYISGVNLFVDGAWKQTTYPDMRKVMERLSVPEPTEVS